METCLLPMPIPPPCQTPAFSTEKAATNGKEQYLEGEFAALLTALQKPAAKTGDSGQMAEKPELIVPAALQLLIQPVYPAGAGGEGGKLPVTVPVRQAENGNALTVDYEIACLTDALTTELKPLLAAVERKRAAVSGASVLEEPALATQNVQKDDYVAVAKVVLSDAQPTVGTPTEGRQTSAPAEEKRAAVSGVSVLEEPALATQNVQKDDYAAAKIALGGPQQTWGTPPEGKQSGGPEQEKGETKLAESSAQPSVRPVWHTQEPLRAEAVRRLQAIKSAVLEQVLEKMVFSRNESGEAKVFVRLKPPSLGEVQISLHLEEGRLTGRIMAENAMVRELLEASLGQLKQRLEAQQVQVAELTVSTGQEREWYRGRDRPEMLPSFAAGREKGKEGTNAVLAALPGLLNALA